MFRTLDSHRRRLPVVAFVATAALGLTSLAGAAGWNVLTDPVAHIFKDRNFYGVLKIDEYRKGRPDHLWALTHGRIAHGVQFHQTLRWPTSYYASVTGIGLAIRFHPDRHRPGRQFRIGVVGLGIGTLTAYANARVDERGALPEPRSIPDYVRYYEINPMVRDWANEYFTYVSDARVRGADVEVLLGDARIVMERQLERGEAQAFDVLAIDAFTSDAIPMHLLTKESLAIYWQHLKEDGVLALHVSNRFLDLRPVVRRLAAELGIPCVSIRNEPNAERGVDSATWLLMTHNRAVLDHRELRARTVRMPPPGPLWTDDFSSIFEVLK